MGEAFRAIFKSMASAPLDLNPPHRELEFDGGLFKHSSEALAEDWERLGSDMSSAIQRVSADVETRQEADTHSP